MYSQSSNNWNLELQKGSYFHLINIVSLQKHDLTGMMSFDALMRFSWALALSGLFALSLIASTSLTTCSSTGCWHGNNNNNSKNGKSLKKFFIIVFKTPHPQVKNSNNYLFSKRGECAPTTTDNMKWSVFERVIQYQGFNPPPQDKKWNHLKINKEWGMSSIERGNDESLKRGF